MRQKPFRTIREQVDYLSQVKNISTEYSAHKYALIKIGYFNIVNAYKSPFVESITVNANGRTQHVYFKGTHFDHFLAVHELDNNIRKLVFSKLTKIEEEVKNIFSYLVEQKIDKDISWKNILFYNPSIPSQDVSNFINEMNKNIAKNRYNYLSHYLENYQEIPLWITTKVLSLGTFIRLLNYQNSQATEDLCSIYGILNSNGINEDKSRLISILNIFRIYRNACAHNERILFLYREKGADNNRHNQVFKEFMNNPNRYIRHSYEKIKLIDLLISLRYFLNDFEYQEFLLNIKVEFQKAREILPSTPYEKLRSMTGIKNLEDLDYLSTTQHFINYDSILS